VRVVPPYTLDIQSWAENIRKFLGKALNQLDSKDQYSSAAEDGVILWDRTKKYVVVSSSKAFRQVATQQSTPASNVGAAGDVAGMIAWDTNYIYICVGTYNGSASIWKRASLSSW
tara:strand:+ start:3320 stop:3664 length:345 start_codon:yes stop_codon:yes gene_type:complete